MNFLKSKVTFAIVFILYVGTIGMYYDRKGQRTKLDQFMKGMETYVNERRFTPTEYVYMLNEYNASIDKYEQELPYILGFILISLIYLIYYFIVYIK
jgi:hypothetical protein